MATESFLESLIIKTEEQLRILEELIDEANANPPKGPSSDVLAKIRRGMKLVDEGYFDDL